MKSDPSLDNPQRKRRFRERADRALIELFRSIFEEIDLEKVRLEVASLEAGSNEFAPAQHARVLTRRAAIRCAATGALTGIPSGAFAFSILGADLAYLVYQQFRLVLGIAAVYGHEPTGRERFEEAVSCLAWGSGAGIGKHGVSLALHSAGTPGGVLAEKIGTRLIRDRLSKAIPVIGIVSGGAINYLVVLAVGRSAVRYYEQRAAADLEAEIWAEGDREHA